MMRWLWAFGATFVAFVVVDGLWLYFVAVPIFKSEIGSLLRAQPDLAATAVFYLVYPAGLAFLAVLPAINAQSWRIAALNGAVLGAIAYATFDLTNLAILKGWTWRLALIDIAWGTVVSLIAAVIGYKVTATVLRQRPVL